ncbi:Uncharacterized protein BM_BM3854 [Brugia malayi]|uniref:SCHIP-1 domain-containing protein n=1 Tax=Brugia malayi TaxID=6279 RepID=A0A4E9EZ03_BRUMA|nr:Uncharacterized protein BM_BM3854 [Brugia malayi]VIO88967.1 Uncharacterized protein BM_BM3854 [Brugia malayi]
MWQRSGEVVLNAESKHNLCSKSLLHSLVNSRHIGSISSSSLDQQSNSSSLESIKSFTLDGNQALSTSCSEDSFEMSSTTSRPATEDPSQLSLQNLASSFLGLHNLMHPSNISLDYQDRKSSEYTSSDQTSKDSLEPCSSLGKSSSLKNMNFSTKTNPLTLTSYHLNELNDAQEIFRDEATGNSIVNRGGARMTESRHFHGACGAWKFKNFIKNDKASLREYIDKELDNLDTCLPQLDFNKLEEKLNCAAKERLITERKLLGEQVRRRLALQVDHYTAEPPALHVYKGPAKSNLGFRLQTATNLQVCYINGLKDEDEEESSDDDFSMPKSKSAPNLQNSVIDGSNLNASQLRQAISAIKEKRQVLEEETKMMLTKAKQAARMQMEIEKINTNRFTTAIPPKASRLQLSKMTRRQLIELSEKISKRINEENAELMRLLVEKDSLYMQQDSMLVDIEDMIQHESNSESLNLPDFLKFGIEVQKDDEMVKVQTD